MGNAGVSFRDVLVSTLNVLPATAVFFGIAVLLLGTRPTLAVPLAGGGAVAMYLLSFIGPSLSWPNWLLDLSPFHHLTNVPVDPVAWTAIFVLLLLTVAMIAIGLVTYQRRDLAS
jgi:ABC-2 type transport system permease protein